MKCDRCGLQSDVVQAFSKENRLFRRPRYFCPDCTVRRHTTLFILQFVLLFACGLPFILFKPLSTTAALYLQIAFALFFMAPLIVTHELAHAAVAWLMGLRVFGLIIGTGRTVMSGKFRTIDWALNLLPIGGITLVGPRPVPHIRWRLFLIFLAGPASHVVIALAAYLLRQILPFSVLGYQLLSALIVANVFLAAGNLFPRKVSVMTGMQGTDGWHLLRAPFIKEAELTKQYIGAYGGEAMQAYAAHDLDAAQAWAEKALALDESSSVARNILGVIQMARRQYHESRETFLKILGAENKQDAGMYYLLLNNVAYLDALLADPSLLPEADQFSADALKHLPWLPAAVGTRGTVLVELGQLDEGIALLKKSMAKHADKQGKALNACHVAIGEIRRGSLDEARKYLGTANTLDPHCFLLPEVESQLAAAARAPATGSLLFTTESV